MQINPIKVLRLLQVLNSFIAIFYGLILCNFNAVAIATWSIFSNMNHPCNFILVLIMHVLYIQSMEYCMIPSCMSFLLNK